MNKLIIVVLALAIIGGLAFVVLTANPTVTEAPPVPIVTTDPPPTEPLVSYPQPNQVVASPLEVIGQAPGSWFFEASFPVSLLDGNGQVLASSFAQTEQDWMTVKLLDFKSTLTFASSTTATGTLLLANDNPSGLPENSKQLAIPIRFQP